MIDSTVTQYELPVGLSATQLASAMGARVIAIDVDPTRLARSAGFGSEVRINAATDNVVDAIYSSTGGAVSNAPWTVPAWKARGHRRFA